jgi:protein-tyrosine phosphatase
MADPRIGVLFICTGNICRSPLAEGIFVHKATRRGVADRFRVESAGTGGWHAGELADPRMRQLAESRGVKLVSRARQVRTADFRDFDHLICMDESHREHLFSMGAPLKRLRLLLQCDPNARMLEVPDPYYGGADGFELVFDLVDSACEALLDQLAAGVTQATNPRMSADEPG